MGKNIWFLVGVRGFAVIEAATSFTIALKPCEPPEFSSSLSGQVSLGIEGGVLARYIEAGKGTRDNGIGVRGTASVGYSLSISCSGEECEIGTKIGLLSADVVFFANVFDWFEYSKTICEMSNDSGRFYTSTTTRVKNPFILD